mmetsp:Transcript_22457/g.52112  ORF Transcript_22457/g.52112 Transcript_22457/m.52112 type:complete len:367 (-) Transcript_22457:247-1347(-)|eukprot:CAMPEP_0171997252 /NCGR_PEP_ID=MMETSP1041-20130122/580_1 /TAXON_ID=464988 /ORGANISM="Hemiselmis andersenii, Strain CCMP439" /LENGTH=366 /DNA_ID=CAMNT_0012650499 /DNA_START=72 /DNA_END=1172 /DNA_ORIENTATION=+
MEEKMESARPSTMFAIEVAEYGDPDVLKCLPSKLPQPGKGEVLVSMRAAGVNPVETYIRSGKYAKLPTLPYTPGGEGAGFVSMVGEGVTKVAPNQRVYLAGSKTGTYAQYTLCSEATVFPLPDNVSFEQGACLGTAYATAHRAVFRSAQAVAGNTVLVHGATGGVGLAAVQLAKACGCIVIGSGSSKEGRDMCQRAGADHVVDHSSDAHFDEVVALTGGKGVDIIIEMLANQNLAKDLGALAIGGRVAVVGSRGPIEINPRELMQKETCIVGVANAFQHSDPLEAAEMHQRIFDGLKSGALKPIVNGSSFTLKNASKAHEYIANNKGAQGKVVLKIDQGLLFRSESMDSTTVDMDRTMSIESSTGA